MPPWQNINPIDRTCLQCAARFQSKRTAKFCSIICQSRTRPKRAHDSVKSKMRRERRLAEPGYRERVNAISNVRARSIRAYLAEIKMARGCVDCGYRAHPAALDFDHLGDKERLVSFAKSIAQAAAEIAKCEVRCSNCHRIRTWERRKNKQPCKPDIFAATYEPA